MIAPNYGSATHRGYIYKVAPSRAPSRVISNGTHSITVTPLADGKYRFDSSTRHYVRGIEEYAFYLNQGYKLVA